MSTPRIPAPLQSPASPSGEARPVLRAKTIATRVTPEELAEVETAAEGAGKTLAEWLRELALKAARERPARPYRAGTGRGLGTAIHAPKSLSRDGTGERRRQASVTRFRGQNP
jgi:hypothetical protein